jgi:hypothetical protein
MALSDDPVEKRHFFVSFNEADRTWATWIAWVLEESGYTVWFQDWDFRGNFIEHMNRAHAAADRTVAVLSESYFGSDFTFAEWSARLAQDPAAREDRLIPIKVGPFTNPGMLAPILYADLTECDETEAHRRLYERIKMAVDSRYRPKPKVRPGFPGISLPSQVRPKPPFPVSRHAVQSQPQSMSDAIGISPMGTDLPNEKATSVTQETSFGDASTIPLQAKSSRRSKNLALVDMTVEAPTQGSTQEAFQVLLDLRHGVETCEDIRTNVAIGVSKLTLRYEEFGCQPTGPRYGDDGNVAGVRVISGGWEFAAKPGDVLTNHTVEVLARFRRTDGNNSPNVTFEAAAHTDDLRPVFIGETMKLPGKLRGVLGKYLVTRGYPRKGTISFGSATLRWTRKR